MLRFVQGVSDVKDTFEHNNQLSITGGCEHEMPQGFIFRDGIVDWAAYHSRSNTHLSFQERINSNMVIEDSVASHVDANMTSYSLARKYDAKQMDIVFRDLSAVTNGEIIGQAAHILSYDCVYNQFVLRFFHERPDTLEQLGKKWYKAEEVLRINLASFIHILYGRRGFVDERPSWMADYGFQLCVLIEMGVFITDFLHVFEQQQYYGIDDGELWMIRPILKEWRQKLVDLTRFPDMIFEKMGNVHIQKHDKQISPKLPRGKTKLLDDYESGDDIGPTLRIKNMGPLRMRECLRPRSARVGRLAPHGTRSAPGSGNTSPNPIQATVSGGSTRNFQDRNEVCSEENFLKLLKEAYRSLNITPPCTNSSTSAQDGRSVSHGIELPKMMNDIRGALPRPTLPPVNKTNSDHANALAWDKFVKLVSGFSRDTQYPNPATSPPSRILTYRSLGDDPHEDKDLDHFHNSSDPFASTSPSHNEYISHKSGGSSAKSNRRNNWVDVTFSTSTSSQPPAIKTVNMKPAALLSEERDTIQGTSRRLYLCPSLSNYFRRSSNPKPKALDAPVSVLDGSSLLQRRSLTHLCTSCESTADLHLLVNTRKNSLLSEGYIVTCFNLYSDYFDKLTPEKSWRKRAQFYNWILDNLDRRDGGHADWTRCVESLRDQGADVSAIDEADARVSDDLLDKELNPKVTTGRKGKNGPIRKSVGFVDGPHPTRFTVSVRDGGVR